MRSTKTIHVISAHAEGEVGDGRHNKESQESRAEHKDSDEEFRCVFHSLKSGLTLLRPQDPQFLESLQGLQRVKRPPRVSVHRRRQTIRG